MLRPVAPIRNLLGDGQREGIAPCRSREGGGSAPVPREHQPSQLIDVALDRLIVAELEQRHIAGYLAHPQQGTTTRGPMHHVEQSEVADDIDWARLYGNGEGR